ncbi:MAG TPA: PEP-CTERM sorting domain-containing protein [Cyanobacteria bacterium UBA8803]|nr:PEP-CTERM sorting domain-containing protein [Cyanobacteria bacterium UBA9273]HBL59787.1 PEP-CTERM sorting domain-containing protein [Cyanobacteria bacterium UBA8803]
MGLLSQITRTVAVCTTVAIGFIGTPTRAFTITQNSDAQKLLTSLLGDITGLKDFSITLGQGNDPRAFGLFTDDPFGLASGLVLSTGAVENLPGENNISNTITETNSKADADLSTDFDPTADPMVPAGAEGDSITLELKFYAENTADKLFFQYVFGSEEFPEFGGSDFNDSFALLLNGVNLAKLSDRQSVSINNLVPNPQGPYHPDYKDNPAGTGTVSQLTKLDGYTKVLSFEGLLKKNDWNTLSINIQDLGDGHFDSAVFIKGKSFGTAPPSDDTEPKTVPEPSSILGLLGLSALGIASRHKRHNQP